jgi:Beta-lactamase enzyme family/ORF 12 gene product N-terminal
MRPRTAHSYSRIMSSNVIRQSGFVALVALATMSAACGNDSEPLQNATEVASSATTAGTLATPIITAIPTKESTSSVAAAGPARQRVDWLVGLMNASTGDPAVVAAGFTSGFLAEVPVGSILSAFGSMIGSDTGWSVIDDEDLDELGGTVTISSAQGQKITLDITVEDAAEHQISSLLAQPAIPEIFAPGEAVTGAAIDTKLAAEGEQAGYGLFNVSDGTCRLVHGLEPDRPQPLGSTFKLWVLAALASEIEAGRASWDELLVVDDALKSSSDGEISQLAAGTPVTLRRYAELMISISDNSATDHLLHRLGRLTVEAAMVDAGVADPSANMPLLSTREFFLLKFGRSVQAADYLALPAEDRRALLDGRIANLTVAAEIDPTFEPRTPNHITDLEWFATPTDLCRTHLRLGDLATHLGLEPVGEILAINPGLPFGPEWEDVRYKGGSELGVLFAAWRLQHRDGRVFVVAGGVADARHLIDEIGVMTLLSSAARVVSPGP